MNDEPKSKYTMPQTYGQEYGWFVAVISISMAEWRKRQQIHISSKGLQWNWVRWRLLHDEALLTFQQQEQMTLFYQLRIKNIM